MTHIIQNKEPIPAEYVERLLRASAPERLEDMKALWRKYKPQFSVADDGPDALLQANKERLGGEGMQLENLAKRARFAPMPTRKTAPRAASGPMRRSS